MIRNIIFDWSGTLVDDLPAVWRATNYVLARVGLAELTLEQFRSEFCLPFQKFYDRYTPKVPLEQLEIWFHGHFREVQHLVEELPHARDFLDFCRSHGLRTFLLLPRETSGFEIERLKDKLGVRSMPTGEVRLHDAEVEEVGGFGAMLEMMNLSRLYNSVASVAVIGRALHEARHYAERRQAFHDRAPRYSDVAA